MAASPQQASEQLINAIGRYYDDPVTFAREVLDAKLVPDQIAFLTALAQHKRVSARSGHGTGKSSSFAVAILWFMCTRFKAKVPCTAPTAHQLYDILWAELSKWYNQMIPLFKANYTLTTERFYQNTFSKEWYAVTRTGRKENPDALQGFHGDNLLFIVDEAPGIPDQIFEVTEGALTQPNNYAAMAGQPSRVNGYFFDSHHKDRALWKLFHFNSENSPLVDSGYPLRMATKYGKDSNIYRVRVLGDFPIQESDQLIGIDILEAAAMRDVQAQGQIIWAVDPARFGDDETVLAKRQGDVILPLMGTRKQDTMQVTGWVAYEIEKTLKVDRPSIIYVDTIGVGAGVADRLRELGFNVHDVNVSEMPSNKAQYVNLRTELYGNLRDWLKSYRGKIPNDEDLIAQASSIKYKFDSSGRIALERKEDMKKRGLPSPDRADAVAMCFNMPVAVYEDYEYNPLKEVNKSIYQYDEFGLEV